MDKAVGSTLRDTLNFIDGQYRSSAKTFANINPATGETLTAVAQGDERDVQRHGAVGHGDRHLRQGANTHQVMRFVVGE